MKMQDANWLRGFLYVSVCAMLLLSGWYLLSSEKHASLGPSYLPSNPIGGEEISMVYIGSANCKYCNSETLPAVVERLKLKVQEIANRDSLQFVAIGVGLDNKPSLGIGHLEKFGLFDEVLAGRKWLGMGAERFLWSDIPGQAATPSVLILRRRVSSLLPNEHGIVRPPEFDAYSSVARLVGEEEIRKYSMPSDERIELLIHKASK